MSKFRNFEKYEVFDDGRIWSYKSNKWLKPTTMKNGYQQVALSDNEGNIKMYLLHRVIYEAVTGEPIPPNMQVNHIDENKVNNVKSNLNLMTPKENTNWGSGIERRAKAMTNNQKLLKSLTNNKKLSKQVGAFKNGELILTFPSINEAHRQGFKKGNVCACCNGVKSYKTYKGYEWRYI